jgi:hypothetical protein
MTTVFLVMFCLFAGVYMIKSAQLSFNMDDLMNKVAVAGAFILTAVAACFVGGLGKLIEFLLGR